SGFSAFALSMASLAVSANSHREPCVASIWKRTWRAVDESSAMRIFLTGIVASSLDRLGHFTPQRRNPVDFRWPMSATDPGKLDRIVAEARRAAEKRERGYREQALKIYPWICGRCAREFTRANVRELTVHHRDHNHDNNPPDGS